MLRIGSDAWAFCHLAAEYVSALMIILGRKCCRCVNLPELQLELHADKSKRTLTCLAPHRPDFAPEKRA